MSATDELLRLGYSLRYDYSDKAKYDYPSLVFERITSHGYYVEYLAFRTIPGDVWTFEKTTVVLKRKYVLAKPRWRVSHCQAQAS